jgi:diguanylate cyclase (GGDEF)-like protein
MISIRKYLEGGIVPGIQEAFDDSSRSQSAPLTWATAYCSTLDAFGQAGTSVCPSVAGDLSAALAATCEEIGSNSADLAGIDHRVRGELRNWGNRLSAHLRHQAGDVKQMLLAMAQTAKSVSDRDQRCATQVETLTLKLRAAASLDDLTQIRHSIEGCAHEIKTSIDRMALEGKVVLEEMQIRIVEYQARLEEAELAASVDALTHLRTRMWMEGQLEERVTRCAEFCVAMLDLDGFKFVNDRYGHLAGDELLRQFAGELRASCRATDLVGRWGGDEFLILLDGTMETAEAQIERVRKWVCGSYELANPPLKLRVEASMGLAKFTPPENLEQLLERTDQAMYAQKRSRR